MNTDETTAPEASANTEPTATNQPTAQPTNHPPNQPSPKFPTLTMTDMPDKWREAMARAGWRDLMPVQAQAIPYVMAGQDLMVQSRTGSGKTGAFMLPILERVNSRQDTCQALILAPTRELARQVAHDGQLLAKDSGVRVTAVYGGVSYGPQLNALKKGAHIVVGTPGRILDHLMRKSLTLDNLKILVFDEADRLLSMGFYQDMREVQSYLPEKRVDGFMFSATFPANVMRLARLFLRDPEFLSLSSDNVHVAETEHVSYKVPGMDKDRSLVRIIEVENPQSAIIFCNTKARVHYVAVVLRRFGYDADELSADLSQKEREKVLTRVRSGKLRFLVATDVAARGIDIPELSHVIQYEPPEDLEIYIHRAGRTGRAGAKGVAISLVNGLEQRQLNRIAQRYHIEMVDAPLPSDEDVAAVVSERMTTILETKQRTRDKLKTERMQRFIPLARSLSDSEEGLALLAMLLDDAYQETLHAPPEPIGEPVTRKRDSGGRKRKRRRDGRRRPRR